MSNRVLSRKGARELTSDEYEKVQGADTGCRGTLSHSAGVSRDQDVLCDPDFS
jgi:hypothetical protein